MSWILEQQIYRQGKWSDAVQEFESKDQAETFGDYCMREGFCQHYKVYHSSRLRDGYAEAEPTKIDIERFKKEIADYTNESGYVDIPLSILLDTLYEVIDDKRR